MRSRSGELRYVHRLVAASSGALHGIGRPRQEDVAAFQIEVPRPGILDSLCARTIPRTVLKPNEVEIEVAAAGLNFKDVMMAMGLLPGGTDDQRQAARAGMRGSCDRGRG